MLSQATEDLIARALAEDVGPRDVTTEAVVPADTRARGWIRQKAPGVVYGLEVAEAVLRRLDPQLDWQPVRAEGEWLEQPPATVAEAVGDARALLTGRAGRAQLPPAPVRDRDGDRRVRRPASRQRRRGARHAQDDSRASASSRRRRSPPAAGETIAWASTTRSSSRTTTSRSPAGSARPSGAPREHAPPGHDGRGRMRVALRRRRRSRGRRRRTCCWTTWRWTRCARPARSRATRSRRGVRRDHACRAPGPRGARATIRVTGLPRLIPRRPWTCQCRSSPSRRLEATPDDLPARPFRSPR